MDAKQAFEIWWAAYPKKVGKRLAEQKWVKYYTTMPPLEKMLETLEAQKRMPGWVKDDGEYIPHPTTYINRGSYEDELKVDMPKDIVNEKPWHETWPGIVAKGKELGIEEKDFAMPYQFKNAVMNAVNNQSKSCVVVDLFSKQA